MAMAAVNAQSERDAAPRSGALRRVQSRRAGRGALRIAEPPPIAGGDATGEAEDRAAADMDAAGEGPVAREALENCIPDAMLRLAPIPRRPWRAGAMPGSVGSLCVHALLLASVILGFQAADNLNAGAEEAIPVEFVIAGEEIEQAASQAGAAAPSIDIPPPRLPDIPPIDVARETPPLEVPLPPDIPPVALAPPPAAASFDLPPPPEAPVAFGVAPPVLASAAAELAEDAVPPARVVPDASKTPAAKAPTPAPAQIKTTAKAAPKRTQRAPAPKSTHMAAPRETASAAHPGRGRNGAGESDQTRAASSRGGAAAVTNYRAQVMAHLARFKVYPEQMRERGVTGRATVAFTISRAGQVLSATLRNSSGAPMLDQATLAMVRRAAPFPKAPDEAPAVLSFNAAINYSLR